MSARFNTDTNTIWRSYVNDRKEHVLPISSEPKRKTLTDIAHMLICLDRTANNNIYVPFYNYVFHGNFQQGLVLLYHHLIPIFLLIEFTSTSGILQKFEKRNDGIFMFQQFCQHIICRVTSYRNVQNQRQQRRICIIGSYISPSFTYSIK